MPDGALPAGTGLVWFRRDLRLEDNPAWAAATARHDEVVALYVLDPRLLDAAGPFRRAQLLANLRALDDELRDRGGCLRVRTGDPTSVVAAEATGLAAAYLNADVSPYATSRDDRITSSLSCPVHRYYGTLVMPPGSVLTAKGQTSRVFTPFHRAWSRADWDPWPEAGHARVADDPGEDVRASGGAGGEIEPPLEAGSDGGEARIAGFLRRVDDYADSRDLLASDGASGLSVDLKFGTISPRRLIEVIGDASEGRRAFVRQLAWRDWYAHLLAEMPWLCERALRSEYDRIQWSNDPDEFLAWTEGQTGYPVVDAAMRQLAQTGAMHNRARMIAGSFLVKDLLIDWRWGERHFRHLLTDGDVAQNVGNWQWVAGTGPDAAPYFRVFNPVTQSRRFDPAGAYLRRWLPELADVSDDAIHAPWEAGPLELAAAGVTLGAEYPRPIVDHAAARDRALVAYKGARATSPASQ